MFRLTMTFGGKPLRKFTFEKESIAIGRDATCDIVVENIGASRRHATVERTPEGYVLSDLQSHNGTFVNGEKVFHHRLSDNEEFYIGKYAFRFEALDPVPAAVAVGDPAGDPAARALDPLSPHAPGALPDMTFRLERKDIERIMGMSAHGSHSKLVQLAPEKERRTLVLEGAYCVIGSDASAVARIRGFLVPWRAAVLVRTDQGWRFLGLSRRARVNGRPAADVPLADGDLVQVGRRRFRFCQG